MSAFPPNSENTDPTPAAPTPQRPPQDPELLLRVAALWVRPDGSLDPKFPRPADPVEMAAIRIVQGWAREEYQRRAVARGRSIRARLVNTATLVAVGVAAGQLAVDFAINILAGYVGH